MTKKKKDPEEAQLKKNPLKQIFCNEHKRVCKHLTYTWCCQNQMPLYDLGSYHFDSLNFYLHYTKICIGLLHGRFRLNMQWMFIYQVGCKNEREMKKKLNRERVETGENLSVEEVS